jgi:hypothetical protein
MTKIVNHDLWKQKLSPKTFGERLAFDLLVTTWQAPEPDEDDSNRGYYITRVSGTSLQTTPPAGWRAMEHADSDATHAWRKLADAIDKANGELIEAATDLAKAFNLIDNNDFINSYESNDEAACQHWRGIAREAVKKVARLSVLNTPSLP